MLDPLENNLFDVPDYENTEDETFPPLPPPASPGRDDAEWAQAHADEKQQTQSKDSALVPRNALKRPRPKLDAQRLTSDRGLPALRHIFDNVKFKGKGHEAEDLKTLIQHMEHWAHRLFPQLQFEDFIDRVENLGNKKEVQTCLKRIRLDLPILHEDYKNNEEGEGESNGLAAAAADAHSSSGNAEELQCLPGTALTEEQQERMKKNRQLALERRQARLQGLSQAQPSQAQPSQAQLSELPPSSSGEELHTQDPADLTEDIPVPAAALTEDGDGALGCAREEQ
ncbi:TIMELESS-interacting protein [Pitangus sulphuratus]|nr:TIMELESS-interacting protein [Pitangus sulphuratus]